MKMKMPGTNYPNYFVNMRVFHDHLSATLVSLSLIFYSSSARLLMPTSQPPQQFPLEHLSRCLFILVALYFPFTSAPPYLGRAAQGW